MTTAGNRRRTAPGAALRKALRRLRWPPPGLARLVRRLRPGPLLAGGALAAAALAGALAAAALALRAPIDAIAEPTLFEVRAGSSLDAVADELTRADRLPHPRLFSLLARWRGAAASIRAGEYELRPGISPAGILDLLVAGETVRYRLTLVEGWTFREALARIQRAEKVDARLAGRPPSEIAGLLGLERDSPEGMLFPDTYFYAKGATDLELLRRARARLDEVLARAWEARRAGLPYDTPYEALIMASIIEKETALDGERGHVAGVFVRRLERGMRLQSDPTVIYGMGDAYAGVLGRGDLAAVTPYNTYRIDGLPPTPIALAGEASIRASMDPLPSDYLYFVATGDGGHHFSASLEEHNAAVARYRRRSGPDAR